MDPGYLIASPQMRDPNFGRAVVLLVQHDANGALGLVINRESSMRQGSVVDGLEDLDLERAARPVLWGGPVDPSIGFVLYLADGAPEGEDDDGWALSNGLRVSASGERLAELVKAGTPFQLCFGYAGWGPGQLDREYREGSWVHLDPGEDLLFTCATADRYDRALARMGLRAETLWMTPVDE